MEEGKKVNRGGKKIVHVVILPCKRPARYFKLLTLDGHLIKKITGYNHVQMNDQIVNFLASLEDLNYVHILEGGGFNRYVTGCKIKQAIPHIFVIS